MSLKFNKLNNTSNIYACAITTEYKYYITKDYELEVYYNNKLIYIFNKCNDYGSTVRIANKYHDVILLKQTFDKNFMDTYLEKQL